MAFLKRGKHANYSILNSFSWHVPDAVDSFVMLLWLVAGLFVSILVAYAVLMAAPSLGLEYQQLIIYPIMFIPPFLVSSLISKRNMYFENGYKVDNTISKSITPWLACLLCILGTWAMGFIMDKVNSFLPEVPDSWKTALQSLVGGNFLICFICVSILAPVLEEWLLRGILLRGLLNCKRSNGKVGYSPAASIIATSAIFGIIHLNPWQAIPAFSMGCLFGYVYYKTGSLKLTILMHFANNTLSLVIGQFAGIDESADSWEQIMPASMYYAILAACLAIVILVVFRFRKIQSTPNGNFELIPAEVPEASPLP